MYKKLVDEISGENICEIDTEDETCQGSQKLMANIPGPFHRVVCSSSVGKAIPTDSTRNEAGQ